MSTRSPASLLRRAGVAFVLLCLAALAGAFFVSRWVPDKQAYPMQGVDVSEAQGAIDWKRLRAAGSEFGYIRATFGATGRDTGFSRNWDDAGSAGVRRGAYHDFNLCQLAADQAANFITTVPRDATALPVAIHLDFSDGCSARPARAVVVGEVSNFIQQVEAHAEQPVMLSIDRDFEDEYKITASIDRPIWARQAFFPPDFGTHAWIMWQANPHRRADGVNGPVNWSVVRK